MQVISEETMREEHATVIEFPSFPSIEGFQELALHRMREGPGCVRVNGLLIRDPFCPQCAGPTRAARHG